MKNFVQSVALGALSLVALFALLELAVRAFVPESRWRFLDAASDWQLDAELGWVNRPDLDVTAETAFGPVRFRTNHDGLIPAGATREKPDGAVRVMVFGDSMVVGRSVDQDGIYTARLEALLDERGIRADVVNAGVQGYSTDQALLLMQRWLPVYRPDVVLFGSTLNDYGGNALAEAYGQAKPVFRLDAARRLRLEPPSLAGEVRSFGSGPRRWVQNSALYRLLQPGIFLLRARLFGLEERILLGTEQGVYLDDGTIDALDWSLFESLVVQMKDGSERVGARFLFYAHPEVGEVWDPYIEMVCRQLGVPRSAYDPFAMERRLAALAQRRSIDFVATVGAFREASAGGPFHLVPMDAHMNAAGHRLLAELLADRVSAMLAAPPAGAVPVRAAARYPVSVRDLETAPAPPEGLLRR